MKVAVSVLCSYSFCPRSVYLSEVLGLEPDSVADLEKGLFGHELRKTLIAKQMSLLGTVDDAVGLVSVLRDVLECSFEGIWKNYSSIRKEDAEAVRSEVLADLGALAERLSYIAEDIGFDAALRRMSPWRVDYPVSSGKLRLCGRIDKVMKESFYYPVEIKTCSPPESVWEGDKIQVCAYALLLEEDVQAEKKIPYGFVEYARIPEMRPVMNTDGLRKKVSDTRDEVFKILEGYTPDICPHGNGRKCESCGLSKRCYEI